MDKIIKIIEDLAEMIYIIDLEDYRLVYMNAMARENFGVEDDSYKNRKCYDVVQAFPKQCSFCKSDMLSDDKYYEWTYYNPVTKENYLLKERLLVDENGKLLKMVVIFTSSLLEAKEDNSMKLKNIEQFLLDCVKELHKNNDYNDAINSILKLVGEFTRADRVYIFEINDKIMWNTFEWCNEGVNPEIETLQDLDVHMIDWWLDQFNRDECYVLYDIEEIKDVYPDSYEVLIRQNIVSLMSAPLKIDNQLFGYLGLDNPNRDRINYLLSILDTLSYFVSSIYMKRRTEEYLTKLSYEDSLTKLLNRNRYIADVEALNKTLISNVGVLFIDLNDFKETNDKYGHFIGDEMLINISKILKNIFVNKQVYRYGGDEFIVICQEISKKEFDILFEDFKKDLHTNNYSASIGYVHSEELCDISQLIKNADYNMYYEKQKYYKKTV